MTTTRAEQLEEVVRVIAGRYTLTSQGDDLDWLIDDAKNALATPATEPQGYVEPEPVAWRTRGMGLHDWDQDWKMCDKRMAEIWMKDASYRNGRRQVEPLFAARPAPQPAAWAWDADGFLQPAADTRVVTVAQLESWRDSLGYANQQANPRNPVWDRKIKEIEIVIERKV